MMGVDYNLFWTLTPKDLEPFKKAFQLSQRMIDIHNWQLGNYMRFAIGNAFSPKDVKYPNKPFLYDNKEDKVINEEIGRENNRIVRELLLDRIRKRKLKSSGGDVNE